MVMKMNRVAFQKAKSRDPVQQEEAKRLIMKEMTKCFLETHASSNRASMSTKCNMLYCSDNLYHGGMMKRLLE